MNGLKYLALFAAGLVVGSAASYVYLKEEFEKREEAAVESVKAHYLKRELEWADMVDSVNKLARTANELPPLDEADNNDNEAQEDYEDIVRTNYNEYSNKEEVKPVVADGPYVIPPEEFGELDEYETCELTYFTNGYLVDEDDELIEDIDSMVGKDVFTHFGEYEEDSIYVRNDRYMCDYVILRDPGSLKEMMEQRRAACQQDDE